MNMKYQRIWVFLLAAALLASCGVTPPAAAATMHLRRTEGTVGVSDGGGKDMELRDDLGLYSGYEVETKRKSFAWIDLDEVKLTKLDEKSEIEIVKEDKTLEIEIKSGSLFFNVSEPLADDETMTIRSSTMAVGIRGTCGWVSLSKDALSVYLLEGKVQCESDGQYETVQAGEMAVITEDGEIEVKPFTTADIPAFVTEELEADDDLAEAILDASGLDVLNPPDLNEAAHTAYEQVFAEFRDAHAKGLDLITEYSDDFDWSNPPDLSAYRYITDDLFTYGWPNQYAYYDIDGNGVDELIMIQTSDWYTSSSNIYAFNGSEAVLLQVLYERHQYEGQEYLEYENLNVLTDGTFVGYVGNGGMIGGVHRLSADGYTLEDIPDSPYLGSYEWPGDLMLINQLEPIPLY